GIRDLIVTGVQTCALPISILPMSISVAGTNRYQTGVTSRQLAIGTGTLASVLNLNWSGPSSANPFTSGSSYRQLLGFDTDAVLRSEERRVGKGGRSRGWAE